MRRAVQELGAAVGGEENGGAAGEGSGGGESGRASRDIPGLRIETRASQPKMDYGNLRGLG